MGAVRGTYYRAIFPGWFGIHQPFLDSGICSLLIATAAAVTVVPIGHLLRENDRLREAYKAELPAPAAAK
jgi:hypothetical protein